MDLSLDNAEENGNDYLISHELNGGYEMKTNTKTDSNADPNENYNNDYNDASLGLEDPIVKSRVKRMGS